MLGFSPDADGRLGCALAVAINQPHVTSSQCTGNGKVHGQRGFAYSALGVPNSDDHVFSPQFNIKLMLNCIVKSAIHTAIGTRQASHRDHLFVALASCL